MRSAIRLLISIPIVMLIVTYVLTNTQNLTTGYCSTAYKSFINRITGNSNIANVWCSYFPNWVDMIVFVFALSIVVSIIGVWIKHHYSSHI